MAITEPQRQARKNFIGSSEVGALFTDDEGKSLHPFMTLADLVAQKIYDIKEEEISLDDPRSRGNRWEPMLVSYLGEYLDCDMITEPEKLNFISPRYPRLAANLDSIACTSPKHSVGEAKTSGIADGWGEPGTDEVPSYFNLQVQTQMHCSGLDAAYIVAARGNFGIQEVVYVVERHDAIIKAILERAEEVYDKYIIPKRLPEQGEPASLSTLKRITRQAEKYADLDPAVILKWDELRQQRLDKEKEEKAALEELLTTLGDAEAARLGDGREFTYFQQTRANIDSKKLKSLYPEIYDICNKPSIFRKPNIRKARG